MNKKSCLVFMDIKSLGDIFNKQMSTSSQSFSTFLTLSRSLELFISKQLALICSGYKMDCLYASGDDIVFITDMIDAQIIVSKIIDGFNKYTGNNTVFNWNVKIEKITKNNISEIYKNLFFSR